MIRWLVFLAWFATGATAQVSVDPDRSAVRDGWWTLRVELGLSDAAPYRVFTLDDPRRLIIDFQGVDWTGIDPDALLSGDRASAVRIGPFRPGWSRMVVDLADPLKVVEAGMRVTETGADVTIVMERVSESAFAATAGAPPDAGSGVFATHDPMTGVDRPDKGGFVVVLDPGHGGIDPGAERDGMNEADLMLVFANEIAAQLETIPGVSVLLTRDADVFVPLFTRMSIARAAKADLFISLHADALAEDEARGAAVYTLSDGAEDRAAQQLVERHARGDLLSGVDLQAQEDAVAKVLMDMARADTAPIGLRFADALVAAMRDEGVYLNSRPHRHGRFAVLSAADFPSVLLEAGFLSNAQDRAVLQSVDGRARIARAIAAAVAQISAQSD